MTPTDKKDNAYWIRRHKNNEAAKRSREKRRLKGLIMQSRLLAVSEENAQLRAQLFKLHCYGSLDYALVHSICFNNTIARKMLL
uniref:BZIP domain-containing protein n=1 Tax=Gouania willdenowi TaxID=441366 RepID=A0A8C5N8Y5_GOUWI